MCIDCLGEIKMAETCGTPYLKIIIKEPKLHILVGIELGQFLSKRIEHALHEATFAKVDETLKHLLGKCRAYPGGIFEDMDKCHHILGVDQQ